MFQALVSDLNARGPSGTRRVASNDLVAPRGPMPWRRTLWSRGRCSGGRGDEARLARQSFPLASDARPDDQSRKSFQQELKRHTRIVRISPNGAACLRPVTTLCAE